MKAGLKRMHEQSTPSAGWAKSVSVMESRQFAFHGNEHSPLRHTPSTLRHVLHHSPLPLLPTQDKASEGGQTFSKKRRMSRGGGDTRLYGVPEPSVLGMEPRKEGVTSEMAQRLGQALAHQFGRGGERVSEGTGSQGTGKVGLQFPREDEVRFPERKGEGHPRHEKKQRAEPGTGQTGRSSEQVVGEGTRQHGVQRKESEAQRGGSRGTREKVNRNSSTAEVPGVEHGSDTSARKGRSTIPKVQEEVKEKDEVSSSDDTPIRRRFAVVCASNVNRSVMAHQALQKNGFSVESFGAGSHVKLPGKSKEEPVKFQFNTPYRVIRDRLVQLDEEFFRRNGVLGLIERDAAVKQAPESWQKLGGTKVASFDVVLCFDSYVFDRVIEDLLARDPEVFKPVHVILMTIRDTTRDSAEAAGDVISFCKMVNILELSRTSSSSCCDVLGVVLMSVRGRCYCSAGIFDVLCGACDEGERESARARAYAQDIPCSWTSLAWVAVVVLLMGAVTCTPCRVVVGAKLPLSSLLMVAVEFLVGVEFEASTTPTGLPETFDKDMVSARTGGTACVEVVGCSMMMAMWPHPPRTDGKQRAQLSAGLLGLSRGDTNSCNPCGDPRDLKPSITIHAANGSHIAEHNHELQMGAMHSRWHDLPWPAPKGLVLETQGKLIRGLWLICTSPSSRPNGASRDARREHQRFYVILPGAGSCPLVVLEESSTKCSWVSRGVHLVYGETRGTWGSQVCTGPGVRPVVAWTGYPCGTVPLGVVVMPSSMSLRGKGRSVCCHITPF